MTILGIDYGAKKVGLAISDEKKQMALPLKILLNTDNNQIFDQICI